MGTKLKNKNNTPETPVSDYLRARDFRDQRTWMLRKGKLYTYVDGEKMSQEDFDRKFPVPKVSFFYRALENPDKSKSYLQ
tara:strand:+ start:945 stop:1184 length:240 start_codon:yes stop_codon:yes gene_type:complete